MLKTLAQRASRLSLAQKPLACFGAQDAHFNIKKQTAAKQEKDLAYRFPHPVWSKEDCASIQQTHKKTFNIGDKIAYGLIQSLRFAFDITSGYKPILPSQSKEVSERIWVNRIIFLETVAGVPGFAAGMHRHLRSLRKMQRDHSWIHTLIEEAENERVHLLTFLYVKEPTSIFKAAVIGAQFGYVSLFFTAYAFFPRVCHRLVGYLEEEAVKTYTHCLEEIDREGSPIHHWKTQVAPALACEYWNLPYDATLRDVVEMIRADEAHHRDVNHTFGDDYTQMSENPFSPKDHSTKI